MQVDSTTGVSRVSLTLLLLSVSCASLSVLFHSKIDFFSDTFFSLCTVFTFFTFIKLINSIANAFPRPIETVFHWTHAMSFEVLAILMVLTMRFFRVSKTFTQPVGNLKGRPVLLIHGYCNDGSVWNYMKYRLAKENIGPIYLIDLGSPFRSIRDYALEVQKKADFIRLETNRSDLVLIGHSMGGVVGSLYATEFAPAKTVTDVITIGSPLGGTYMAKIAIGQNAKEMECNSKLLAQLHEEISKEQLIRFYHIGTNTDQFIIPFHSALLKKNPSREFLFEDIGHASMLFSPRVGALIASWLRESNTS